MKNTSKFESKRQSFYLICSVLYNEIPTQSPLALISLPIGMNSCQNKQEEIIHKQLEFILKGEHGWGCPNAATPLWRKLVVMNCCAGVLLFADLLEAGMATHTSLQQLSRVNCVS
jgi:hypothetical protein